MKKLIISIFLAFGMNFGCFAANNATDVYLLAQSGDAAELKAVENIDVVDSDGNTALCSAIKFNDVDAYNILKKAGANTEHKCVKKIPSEQYKTFLQKVGAANKSWSFLGMGKWAWAAIGAGVAGGAVAAGMGGGGGSGGSSGGGSSETGDSGGTNVVLNCVHGTQVDTNCLCETGYVGDACETFDSNNFIELGGQIYPRLNCVHGTQNANICVCTDGYVGDLCDTPTTCPYQNTSCSAGFHQTDSCQSGETTYVQCEPDACEEFNYTSCPQGWDPGESCQSGNVTKYKCNIHQCQSNLYTYFEGVCPAGFISAAETGAPSTCWSGNTLYKLCKRPSCSTGANAVFLNCDDGWVEVPNPTGYSCTQNGITYRKRCEAITCSPDYVYTDSSQCPTGWQIGSSCKSGDNPRKYKCDQPVACPSNYQNSCTGGYQETGNTCSSGGNTYVECEQIQCGANATWTESGCVCNDGYQNWTEGVGCEVTPIDCGINATQQGTQCQCNDGYQNWTEGVGCEPAPIDCGVNATQQGTQCQCNDGYQNWTEGVGCEPTPIDCGVNATQQGAQCQCNVGYGNWTEGYGCYEMLECGANAIQSGNNCVCNPGYQNWIPGQGCGLYGIFSDQNADVTNNELGELFVYNDNAGTADIYGIKLQSDGTSYVYNGKLDDTNEVPDNLWSGYKISKNARSIGISNTTGDSNIYGIHVSSNSMSINGELFLHTTTAQYTLDKIVASVGGYINIDNHAYGRSIDDHGNIGTDGYSSGDGDVYGIFGNAINAHAKIVQNHAMSLIKADSIGRIRITNVGDGNVFGMYNGNANAKTEIITTTQSSQANVSAYGDIIIQNTGNGNIYGMYGTDISNAISDCGNAEGYIIINNKGNGDVYGMNGAGIVTNANSTDSSGTIIIRNDGIGNIYGMYTESGTLINNGRVNNNSTNTHLDDINAQNSISGALYSTMYVDLTSPNPASTHISIINKNSGTAHAMYNQNIDGSSLNASEISIQNLSNGDAVGMYTNGGTVINTGTITINNIDSGRTIGMLGSEGSVINNSGAINITRDTYTDKYEVWYSTSGYAIDYEFSYSPSDIISGDVFGIYAKSGSTVNNSGTINITTNGNAYGIYVESGSTVTNTGTITLNGVSCDGATCNGTSSYNNHIVLNGSTLYNSGLMMAPQMNLNSMGGNVVAGLGSQFLIENELSGDLNISSELVQDGNQTTYIAENMINAGDISNLNVRSASAMFDATMAGNGHDVVMTMRNFDDLTDNKSLASFLASNYSNGKGSDFFSTLKSMENMSAFNGALSGLTGLNTFTQFAHEDLSAMREISFSMNNKLFENSDRDSFDISGSMGYFSFSNSRNGGSGQYGISSEKISDNWKLGYGMAMANINTGSDNGMNRQNKMWLFYMPATYTNDDYELVIAPKAGFANSDYNRLGYNNVNYEGYIEKRIFGLMNDLRYPLTFGNWTFAPDLAFNTIVYTQRGHEEEREFSLVIPDDRTVSVETGFGLYTKYEKSFENGSQLKLNSGLMAYREFGDSYDIKLGIRGMDGTFNLYNNDYKYRGAASFGFDYSAGNLHLYGNAQYFMDNDNYMNFKGGVSYRF